MRRLVIVIGRAVVAATGFAVLSMTGGPSESAAAVEVQATRYALPETSEVTPSAA
jgi:hypothetical protein